MADPGDEEARLLVAEPATTFWSRHAMALIVGGLVIAGLVTLAVANPWGFVALSWFNHPGIAAALAGSMVVAGLLNLTGRRALRMLAITCVILVALPVLLLALLARMFDETLGTRTVDIAGSDITVEVVEQPGILKSFDEVYLVSHRGLASRRRLVHTYRADLEVHLVDVARFSVSVSACSDNGRAPGANRQRTTHIDFDPDSLEVIAKTDSESVGSARCCPTEAGMATPLQPATRDMFSKAGKCLDRVPRGGGV